MNKRLIRQIRCFERGDYVKVSWFDASDARGPLSEHKKPECLVEEWGVFLGVEGSPGHLLLGKHYIKSDRFWEATRIPLSLIQVAELIAKQAAAKVSLRKYTVRAVNVKVEVGRAVV